MQSYKLCVHLISSNFSHSSKVLTFLCHGETFQCILKMSAYIARQSSFRARIIITLLPTAPALLLEDISLAWI